MLMKIIIEYDVYYSYRVYSVPWKNIPDFLIKI